ncbi:MAG TPA: DNRLRE domain-containing protein, partial [Propionibacteriaceae bacterium]
MSGILRRAVVQTAALLLGTVVAVPAGLVLSASSASAATPVTVIAGADSYVDSALPTSNFGTRTSFPVDGSPLQIAYLKFNIPSGTALSGGVKLRIFAQSTHSIGATSYSVANTSWTETGITYNNAPALGDDSGKSGPLAASTWAEIDVTSAVRSTGAVSLALKAANNTALRITSKEGTNKPQLVIGGTTTPPPTSTEFTVSPVAGGPYQAVSGTTTYTGTLKSVGQRAVTDLKAAGGGTVRFTSGDFDFGSDYFVLSNVTNIDFVGAGIDATVIRNYSEAAADTEPFSFTGANGIKIRNMTVSAGGTARSSSDVLDFDRGNSSLVENVKITGSRARGIVFDGKDAGATAEGNTVRNCRITGIPGAGVEFLASSRNTVTGCNIRKVGAVGVYAHQSSGTAAQPYKKSSDNIISGNTIEDAGRDGVYISNGDRNQVINNTITNSSDSDLVKNRDGIRISSVVSGLTCDDNSVSGNTATDNQTTKTQAYGLNIASGLCNRTVVGSGNNF